MARTDWKPDPGNSINQYEGWDELRAGDRALDAQRAADLEAMAEIRLKLPDESEAVGREWASMRLWPHVEAVAWIAAKRPDLMEQIGAYRHYWHDLHRHDPDAEHMAEQACWSLLGGRLKPGEIRAAKELLARHVAGGRPILDDGGRYIADEVRALAAGEASAPKAGAEPQLPRRGYGSLDDPLIDRIEAMINAGEVTSPFAAAVKLAPEAAGLAAEDSKVRRLERRYYERHPEQRRKPSLRKAP